MNMTQKYQRWYDNKPIKFAGIEYEVLAIFFLRGRQHKILSRGSDRYLFYTILGVTDPRAVDHGYLISIENKQDAHVLKWSYTRDHIYHCFHICFCDKCRQGHGKWFTHSQGNWDDHLRYVDVDDLFTFPTVDDQGHTAQEVHGSRVTEDSGGAPSQVRPCLKK